MQSSSPSITSATVTSVGAAATPTNSELLAYARRSLINTALGLLLLLVVLGTVSLLYEQQLMSAAGWVSDHLGLAGLAALVLIADTLISPLPPDVVLLVVANTSLSSSWLPLVLGFGIVSVIGGCLGWLIGRTLRERGRAVPRFLRTDRMTEALVARYGRWAVALGALTPIPFSVTCWLAGMCKMRFAAFAPVTLLRIPRFVVYYIVIARADDLARFLF